MGSLANYRALLALPAFRWFWSGFALSSLGDTMSQVALVWTVFETSHSAETLAFFSVAYTGPVLVGGFVAGWLLDRFDRRAVMIADSLFRGAVVATVPVVALLGRLELWHLFVVAAVYGFLKMVTLAGGPSVVPAIVSSERLDAANSMESLAWTITGVAGPAIAGLLIPVIGGPMVLTLDALSYFAFAVGLARVPAMPPRATGAGIGGGYREAVQLFLSSPVLLATTLMFMCANVGQGLAFVWLPVFVSDTLRAGPEIYGLLLGVLAVGEVIGSFAAGGLTFRLSTGQLIACTQMLAGVSVGVIVAGNGAAAALGMLALGIFSAPMTIWAQSLRMRIIPARLRGRSFALLRTLMQGATPIGGGLGGVALAALGLSGAILLSAAVTALPGALGLTVAELRRAGARAGTASAAD